MTEILDAHVHFWDPRALRYPWLDDVPALNEPFPPQRLRRPVDVIVVEAGRAEQDAAAEVEWIRREAHDQPWIRGIVAHVPLENPARAAAVLRGYRDDPFVVGVRRNVQDEAPGFLGDKGFRAGVGLLGEAGLPFDACVRAHQLTELAELAAACPETTIVLDHLGKPAPGADLTDWRRDVRRLATHGNVVAKLSGLVTEAVPGAADAVLVDVLREALDTFGPDRCLYGSDWPVLTLATDYDRWLDTVHTALSGYPAGACADVLCDNATRLYRRDLRCDPPSRP
ncbi:MAG TPA: amidohydrolase family protein [Pseudonocardiaceae bacterium]|nr:amidohydrolase family protein [Pseudonocardiaceae bacterium]